MYFNYKNPPSQIGILPRNLKEPPSRNTYAFDLRRQRALPKEIEDLWRCYPLTS